MAATPLVNGSSSARKPSTALAQVNEALPFSGRNWHPDHQRKRMRLDLQDGQSYDGYSFGAERSIAGELVFQTGMVGYPESLTDPSYRGQILVITFPLVGNYGVPSREAVDKYLKNVPANFESFEIHVAGVVIATYADEEYSHHLATSSLGTWLKEQKVPALYGVDTRSLTKRIREEGSMLGKLRLESNTTNGDHASTGRLPNGALSTPQYENIEWSDPNRNNLVAEVSCREPVLYQPHESVALKHPSGRPVRVVTVDVGLKYNQLRCLVNRGVEVLRVPWNYDFPKLAGKDYDGLFISNGPGDPSILKETVEHIREAMKEGRTPIFGICLGHQLLARAAGASTVKMKFGNRGANIPCTNKLSGRCYITSQNHGYAVDAMNLPDGWEELFVNANDGSNEGIRHVSKPYFSVQFHPEHAPGPQDTEFLFDVFIKTIQESLTSSATLAQAVKFPGGTIDETDRLHPRLLPKKVLVLGSGGLSIGQAGEFDYSGSQAIKALKQEGIYTVLINPNIATIQTSKGLADKVYFLPVNDESVRKVIKYERPDAIYVTFGGQTALQVGIKLKDEFEALGVKVLGTPIDTIITTEDRELFARSMDSIGEKCAKSSSASNVEEALAAVKNIGFPVIVRAAYALGGLGSGFAYNEKELVDLCNKAFAASPQVLVERSMKGWKEIEYEVVRDAQDNCITVCNMENFDPLGIHTGDSIVVAPSQTLSDEDYNMLRRTAVNVIRHLGVVGECNIQYALNPDSKEYCIIEVNARLSRSSALASKATGYPLAFVAAKLGLNIPLNEIKNSVTKVTCACFEPSLDYVVVKIPRWDLKKFLRVDAALGSSMKSVGEVMSIGRTFEEAIQKAIRSIDFHNLGFNETTQALMSIDQELQTPSDQRMFAIANAMAQGYSVDKIWEMTRIDKWFLHRLKGLSDFAKYMTSFDLSTVPLHQILTAKQLGFSDRQLAKFFNTSELAVRTRRVDAKIMPFVKQIDTVAAEFPAHTNYLYMTYNGTEHDVTFDDHGIMVLGSGVYRIGSSVEFDWCSVRAIRTLRAQGQKTIMVNYNPETVSTDYDEADRLYFETINLETVLDIYQIESSNGVIISMGGQTPNNIALPLHRLNVKILGTSPEMIDTAENRYKFSRMLDNIEVDQPAWKELASFKEAADFADKVTYPVLVRPSYVLSGAAMNTVYSKMDLDNFLSQAKEVSREQPVVISKYIENAKEIEMDAVALNGKMIGHFISEHVENAGVHSGDATLILPPQDLDPVTISRIEEATRKIGNALNVTGPFNIQFIAKDNDIKVIECNVRASRSFPFVSKVMGVDLIEMATKAMTGQPVTPYPTVTIPKDYVGVKVPQFSFSRLSGADPVLGVEMASTGEVASFGRDKYEAYIKALISTGFKLPKQNILLSIGTFKEKAELLPSIQTLHRMGYKLFATAGTADFLQEHHVPVKFLESLENQSEQRPEFSLNQHLANNMIDLYINLPSSNKFRRPANYTSTGYRTRRMAVDYQVPLVTNVKNAKILIEALARSYGFDVLSIDSQSSHRVVSLPGLVNVSAFVPGISSRENYDLELVSKASIAAGFSMIRVLPLGTDGSITDARALKIAQANSRAGSYCDYNFSVAATPTNAEQISQVVSQVGSLFMPFNQLSKNVNKVGAMTAHFGAWPEHKSIVTDAKTTDLASILLLASLHSRKLHVTEVTTGDDLHILELAKAKGMRFTLDVSVFALFFSQQDYPECTSLPTAADQKALWEHLDLIDVFSIGTLPYQMAHAAGQVAIPTVGIADALPLLLTAVSDGRLTIDDIKQKMHENPMKIFELHEQETTSVEVEVDRSYILQPSEVWSPLVGKRVAGSVSRVIFHGRTACLDGNLTAESPYGKDMSAHEMAPFSPAAEASGPFTPVMEPQLDGLPARRGSIIASQARPRTQQMSTPVMHATPLSSALDGPLPAPLYPAISYSNLPTLLSASPFKRRHVLYVKQFTHQQVHHLFTVAQEMRRGVEREGVLDVLKNKVLCTLFYEPSTRTSASFDAAMQRLGGRTIPIATTHSSTVKGESLADTLRTLACYGDAVVLRHPEASSADIAGKFSPVPVLNGGNGSVEHPTQAFLDLFTIREELGTVKRNMIITFAGDLRYGRTVHSLVRLLELYNETRTVRIQLVSPAALSLPADLRDELQKSGRLLAEAETLTPEIVARTDVLYCTRVQKERFPSLEEYERLKDAIIVDNRVLKMAKERMVILHPLPRNREVSEEVDYDPRAAYFRQMRYGLYIRMALLALVMA